MSRPASTLPEPSSRPRPTPRPTVSIGPPRGWRLVNVRELWRSRDLVYFLVWRDVKVRYRQTVLGIAWAIIQPAMLMVVFALFFGRLAGASSDGVPYPLFAYAGLLPWSFFATSVSAGGASVVGSERLITKVYFPRLAIPFAAVGAAVMDFVTASLLQTALMAYYGVAPGAGIFLLPLVCAPILLTALGVATLLAALNVAYRDFRYVIPFLVQLWMFATPTVYMRVNAGGAPPGALASLLALNPMTGLIAAFRAAALGGTMPWASLGLSTLGAGAVFLLGVFYFRKVEDDFADII